MSASLPARRINRGERAVWEGLEIRVTCGFDLENRVREVFASRSKTDRGIDATLADISILVSHLLQEGGFTAPELLQKLTIMPEAESAAPASLVGVIVKTAVEAEERRAAELQVAREMLRGHVPEAAE